MRKRLSLLLVRLATKLYPESPEAKLFFTKIFNEELLMGEYRPVITMPHHLKLGEKDAFKRTRQKKTEDDRQYPGTDGKHDTHCIGDV